MGTRKPWFRRGDPLPLTELSSDRFENFMYGCVTELGSVLDLDVTQGSSESSDAGFDITARRRCDLALACVQCKCLATTFHLAMIGRELAKVALKSQLEASRVLEHHVITASDVGETLRSALRESSRNTIIQTALEAAHCSSELTRLRESALAAGLDITTTVADYVSHLKVLRVWSGRDLSLELERVWDRIEPLIAQFFAVEIVVREEATPDFDRERYLRSSVRPNGDLLLLRVSPAGLPANISTSSIADPMSAAQEPLPAPIPSESKPDVPVTEILLATPTGECSLLIGPGGGGKTTSLETALKQAARQALADSHKPLPVLLRLARYDGDLYKLAEWALGVRRGRWPSVSECFLFLCDGLDEIPIGLAQRFLDDLERLLHQVPIAAVISLRHAGLRHPLHSAALRRVWKLRLLGMREAIAIAERELVGDDRERFLDELRRVLATRNLSLLALPFGLAVAIRIFRDTGHIPDSASAFIDAVFDLRLRRNREEERIRLLPQALQDVSESTVRALAAALAFELRIVRRRAAVPLREAQAVIATALRVIQQERVFGAAALTDSDAFTLATHYEVFELLPNDTIRLAHDLLADRLAALRLAEGWPGHLTALEQTLADDAWVFAAPLVPAHHRGAFLDAVAGADIVLAARCAAEIGPDAIAALEPAVLTLDEADEMLAAAQSATAMGVLGSDACVRRLRERAGTGTGFGRSNRSYQAQRGLALLGDTEALRAMLAEHDRWSLFPGKVTGGTLPLWDIAPPQVTLRLAREKLDRDQLERGLGMTLRTIELYGDRSDIDRALRVLRETLQASDFYAAGHSLYALDEQTAVSSLSRFLADPLYPNWLCCAELLSSHGTTFDTTRVFGDWCLTRGAEPSSTGRVLKILTHHALPSGAELHLRSDYNTANLNRRSDIWQIATAHCLTSFDDVAIRILSAGEPNAELGLAARFVVARTFPPDVETPLLDAAILRAQAASIPSDSWHLDRILELLLSRGRRQDVAAIIAKHLTGLLPELMRIGQRLREDPKDSSASDALHVGSAIQGMLPAAAEVADLLPHELLQAAVKIDLKLMGEEAEKAYVDIVKRLHPDEVDRALTEIPHSDMRAPALALVSTLGSTSDRVTLLCRDLTSLLRWGHTSKLALAVDSLWCQEVAETVVALFARGEWEPGYGLQRNRELINTIALRMTKEFAQEIVAPAIGTAVTPESREVLQWWYDLALRGRGRA